VRLSWSPGAHLTPQERDLVSALLLHRGCPVSIAEIVELLWPDPDCEPETAYNVIRVVICRLRHKLPGLIRSWAHKSGLGYIVDRPQEQLRAAA
jgi:DNA-binding response OmpR family regulator